MIRFNIPLRIILSLCVGVACSISSKAQDWCSPVDHPIRLSGTFAELRADHFHHGLDIKSKNGVSGDPIRSIGEGWVYRLRVQSAGYGNSVYVMHPEGYISVYAHLLNFSSVLDSIVKNEQFKIEQFEIDIRLDSVKLQIKKGELLGSLGSSGNSFGPHLHFEIRDAATEVTINPLHFGFEIKDEIAPQFQELRLDFLSKEGRKYGEKRVSVSWSKLGMTTKRDTIRIGAWRCGLAVRTQDAMNNTSNRIGIYSITILVDSQLIYQFKGDSVHFHDTRAANVVRDLKAYHRHKERWYLAYSRAGCPLPSQMIHHQNYGRIPVYLNQPQMIDIRIEDFHRNQSSTSIVLLRDTAMINQVFDAHTYELMFDQPNIIRRQEGTLECPQGAFYQNEQLSLDIIKDGSDGFVSSVYQFEGSGTPFHLPCTLRVDVSGLDSTEHGKLRLLACRGKEYYHLGGAVIENQFEALLNRFDHLVIQKDAKPPVLQIVDFCQTCRKSDNILLKIFDEFESKDEGKEISYRATIDGKWIPLSHDVKSNSLLFNLDNLEKGEHVFLINYSDQTGNEGSWNHTFNIK